MSSGESGLALPRAEPATNLDSAAPETLDWTEVAVPIICIAVLLSRPEFLLTLIPLSLVCMLCERARPFRQQRILRLGWKTDVYHNVVNRVVTTAFATAIVAGITSSLAPLLARYLSFFHHQPLWLVIVEGILLADLASYGEHRLSHGRLLWRFHQVHHSSQELDWLAAMRGHPIDLGLNLAVSTTVLFCLQLPSWAIAAEGVVMAANNLLAHSNARLSFGKFWWLMRNPEVHRWHHANEKSAYDTNFAELFPIWDIIFRTSYLQRRLEPKAFGITRHVPVGYVDQILLPFSDERAA